MSVGRKMMVVMKGLIFSYAVTGVLLALLAFLVFKFQLGESITDIAIVAIYSDYIRGGNYHRADISCGKYCKPQHGCLVHWGWASWRHVKLT